MHKLFTYVYTTFCITVSWASNYCVYETDVAAWSLVLLSHHQRPGKRHQHPAATQPHPWDPGSCTCGACFVYGNFTLVRLLFGLGPLCPAKSHWSSRGQGPDRPSFRRGSPL